MSTSQLSTTYSRGSRGSRGTHVSGGAHSSGGANNNASDIVARANVFIRMRPLNPGNQTVVWKTDESVAIDRGTVIEEYPFNRIFTEDNLNVFHSVNDYSMETRNKCLVESVFSGANETIFAYGQTGSGKTHTIFGQDRNEPGLLHMFIQDLFAVKWERRDIARTEIHVRCFEIFGEKLEDLIEPDLGPETEVFLKTARYRYQTVRVDSIQNCLDMLYHAEQARTVGESSCNSRSSRSHCVVQFEIISVDLNDEYLQECSKGTLTFVDLAGSERATLETRVSNSKDMRTLNSSLASLIRLLRQLQRGELHESERRQSVLNKLIFDYVQPTCGIWLIFCISQAKEHRDHTVSTLQLASDSKNIKLAPQKHTFMKYEGELVAINPGIDPHGQQRRENLQVALGMSNPHDFARSQQQQFYMNNQVMPEDVWCEELIEDSNEGDLSTTVPSDDMNIQHPRYGFPDYETAYYHLKRKYQEMLREKKESVNALVDENKDLREDMRVVLKKLQNLERLIYSEKQFVMRTLTEFSAGTERSERSSRLLNEYQSAAERSERSQQFNEHGSERLERSLSDNEKRYRDSIKADQGYRDQRQSDRNERWDHNTERMPVCRPNACAFRE
jgi:hypothetical protein